MVKWRSLIAGALISAVCLWLLLRSVDLAKVGETLSQANPTWIALAFMWIALAIALRCWRWQLLFLPQDKVGFWAR